MDVFEYAMKMEMDGKSYYEEHAAKMNNPALKQILLELAGDEQKHYIIFKSMRDGVAVKYEPSRDTKIFDRVRNVFEQMKADEGEFAFPADAKDVWIKAREIERETETFYREKAAGLEDKDQQMLLNKIADEEHKHWVTMEQVIKFLDRPSTWLENAEWNHLEDY
jgi:rubrerythrin